MINSAKIAVTGDLSLIPESGNSNTISLDDLKMMDIWWTLKILIKEIAKLVSLTHL